ncbi:MAG: hypothetical protein ABI867_10250 [Kofleriaceae bacterium]
MIARVQWLDVWTRAVIMPALRRAEAVWIGCAIVVAVMFGGNGMMPADLTGLAMHHPGVFAVLVATWLLVFVPTARLLVRGDGAAYLRSLPGPITTPRVIATAALIVLQLPWLALWVIGEGLLGLGVVAAVTLLIVTLALWRPPVMRAKWPGWKREGEALRSIHVRALRRRAGDALVRGAGLSIMAGATGGLFVRNNDLSGPGAATVGAAVIAMVLVPAEVGVLLVIDATHRQTAWLAASLGISRANRVLAVVYAIAVVQLGATAIAVVAAALVIDADSRTIGWLVATCASVAIGSAMGCSAVLLRSEDSPTVAPRTVGGSVGVAAAAMLCLGLFGEYGVLAFVATCFMALVTVKA